MAEVLGIVAGAAQLLDLSTRVLVASSSLYGKLKNIPNEIETLKKNTELFIDLLWMISSDFDGPINSHVHSLHVTHRITSILHDAKQESEELALLLEALSSKNSSSARRKWSAVVSATKEKDIAERIQMVVGIQLGGWTLSMVGRLSPHNMVDRKKSPAFIALDEAVRDLQPQGQQEAKALFNTLLQKLREAFESGMASPSDHTTSNFYALHHFAELATLVADSHEHLSHVINDIVELLVAGNADIPNRDPVCTPLYLMLVHLDDTVRIKNNKLDTILINNGCITSHSVQDEAGDPRFVAMFRKNPSLLEGHDQYLAHVAVIQRSETELGRLLRQNKIDLWTQIPSVLSLAVGWTTGLQLLLDAGANPDDAILTAICEDHLPSIELLVDNGCSLFDLDHYSFFAPGNSKVDALFFAASLPASSDVVCLLVQKLVERRLQLLQLATKELPETCLKKLGLHKQQHVQPSPDYNALEVFRQLEAHKVQVPMALWPGSLTTLYHHPGMTDPLAERLYDAGFSSVDELDEKGDSPLINAILHCTSWESIRLHQWYLRNGPRLPRSLAYVDFLDQAKKFTHLISECIWISKGSKLCGPLYIFQQVHPEGVEQRDSCSCWCSTSGCTPVGIVLRQKPLTPFVFTHRQRWLVNLARYSSLGLSLDKDTFADICRLEVFDRLGMAHTCSHQPHDSDGSEDAYCSGTGCGYDNSEREEVNEEDHHLKQALDSYLELYLRLLHIHADHFESFWIAWWVALENFLPFEVDDKWKGPYRPLQLDGVCDPQSYDKAESHGGYNANVEAITAFLADCIPQLTSETRAKFFDQFKLTEYEHMYYYLVAERDRWINDLGGDEDD
ncbi:hypothetical protein CEP52_000428 [Fusarium oligoseptatum]|uniref:Fungal N-terminal domain-containing protein n=1 Tax=Fusarium oligoseptatum TaxID=2604345 RepID=A0A428UNQ5_9HYPO|nr:hypothetical protein CEP52_000428 [Fusarium oligoseptatum]